jgi:hypothetical protein
LVLIEDLWTLVNRLDVEIEGISLEFVVYACSKEGLLGLDKVLSTFGVVGEEETEFIGVYWVRG